MVVITEQPHKYHYNQVTMEELQREIQSFIEKRDWAGYHSPKNLAMALSVEASELVEIFQWLTQEESCNLDEATRTHVEEEIGDIMIYLTTIAAAFDINPIEAAKKKLIKNELKYPPPEE